MKANLFYDDADKTTWGNHGRLKINDKVYILKDEAEFTNRCLPTDNDFELSAPVIDLEGNEYIVYWIFEQIEDAELDAYDYENVDRIEEI